MLFNSFDFLIFFLVVYALQAVLPHRARNVLLIAAGYVFYGAWNWRFLSLLILSTVMDYVLGLAIARTEDDRRRKRYVVLSIAANLALLGFFKYANFFIDSTTVMLHRLGMNPAVWHLRVVLPVGISFYTFQSMGYIIDVYRKRVPPCRKLSEYALFVSFFPQLLAGPIERAGRMIPQFQRKPSVTLEDLRAGLWLILWGLFKKSVIADNLAPIADQAFASGAHLSGLEVIIGVYAFAFQIYADFSGYTDMARGLARLMGYHLVLNFRLPYLATNPQEFWRRWHISLSSWLRDYLYVGLGGNRKGTLRTYLNLLLTMVLGGLWHGAAWTFVLWGAYQGLLLAMHRFMREHALLPSPRTVFGQRVWWFVSWIGMFQLTCVGWLIFRARSVTQVTEMLRAVNQSFGMSILSAQWLWQIVLFCGPLFLIQHLQHRTGDLNVVLKLSGPARATVYVTLMVMLLSIGVFGQREFIYFQF